MMLFDPRAALAEIENRGDTPATSATSATQTPKTTPNVANVADVAAPRPQNQKTGKSIIPAPDTDMRHGMSAGGRPKTWTGKVVSLADWRTLSDWERHGSDGQQWNGNTKTWEHPK